MNVNNLQASNDNQANGQEVHDFSSNQVDKNVSKTNANAINILEFRQTSIIWRFFDIIWIWKELPPELLVKALEEERARINSILPVNKASNDNVSTVNQKEAA